jgi:hypothetical protein
VIRSEERRIARTRGWLTKRNTFLVISPVREMKAGEVPDRNIIFVKSRGWLERLPKGGVEAPGMSCPVLQQNLATSCSS